MVYAGTLGGDNDFNGVTVRDVTAVNPPDYESAITLLAAAGTLQDGAISSAKFAVASPTAGPADGHLEQMQQLWMRFFRRTVYDANAHTLKVYAEDGETVLLEQTLEQAGAVQTQGAAE